MRVALTTVTPIHVGNGKALSPYTDYVIDDQGTIYVMDSQKLNTELARLENSEDVIDQFVQRVMGSAHSRNTYSLKRFLEDYGIDYPRLARSVWKTTADIGNEEIQETIKSGSRPYIPGSSIKGAIRTALLYFHRRKKGYRVEEAMADIYGKKKRKKSPNGEDVFGSFGSDVLKYLHISDTATIPPDDMGIVKTYRYHLMKKETTIPVSKEVIQENKTLQFRLQSKAPKTRRLHPSFTYLYEDKGFTGERRILSMVNRFYMQLIESELAILKAYHAPNALAGLYETIYRAARTYVEEENGAVIRLGSGKTFLDNTIASLFTHKDLAKILKDNAIGDGPVFPQTRAVIDEGYVYESVLGWAYLDPVGSAEEA